MVMAIGLTDDGWGYTMLLITDNDDGAKMMSGRRMMSTDEKLTSDMDGWAGERHAVRADADH